MQINISHDREWSYCDLDNDKNKFIENKNILPKKVEISGVVFSTYNLN